ISHCETLTHLTPTPHTNSPLTVSHFATLPNSGSLAPPATTRTKNKPIQVPTPAPNAPSPPQHYNPLITSQSLTQHFPPDHRSADSLRTLRITPGYVSIPEG